MHIESAYSRFPPAVAAANGAASDDRRRRGVAVKVVVAPAAAVVAAQSLRRDLRPALVAWWSRNEFLATTLARHVESAYSRQDGASRSSHAALSAAARVHAGTAAASRADIGRASQLARRRGEIWGPRSAAGSRKECLATELARHVESAYSRPAVRFGSAADVSADGADNSRALANSRSSRRRPRSRNARTLRAAQQPPLGLRARACEVRRSAAVFRADGGAGLEQTLRSDQRVRSLGATRTQQRSQVIARTGAWRACACGTLQWPMVSSWWARVDGEQVADCCGPEAPMEQAERT